MSKKPFMTEDEFIDALLKKCPQLKVGYERATDGKVYRVIKGIYLKPDTPAAKRLAARGKKYPTFKATEEFKKWRVNMGIDDLEDYANGDIMIPRLS